MGNPPDNKWRYETKFFVFNVDRISVENIILQHHALFSEIHYERYINNVYFDYLGFNNFKDNIDGSANRIKYRIRWYGELITEIEKPVLELKIKKGLVACKKSYHLNKFELSGDLDLKMIRDVIVKSEIEENTKFSMQDQLPVLLNRYRRKYFESYDRKFRITVDDEQSFYKFNLLNNKYLQRHVDSDNVIIELKYNKEFESEADQITNRIPFRLTKSSKYARGIELLYT